jgi:hypothetical protein
VNIIKLPERLKHCLGMFTEQMTISLPLAKISLLQQLHVTKTVVRSPEGTNNWETKCS